MIALSWNCRGLGHVHAKQVLYDLVRNHHLEIVILFETLSNKAHIENIRLRLHIDVCFAVDVDGHSAESPSCGALPQPASSFPSSRNFITVRVKDSSGNRFHLTGEADSRGFNGVRQYSRV
ncbi:hypothetical protein LINGRAHAP2_LOCUS652 [Linum grandiflorum]